MTNNPLPAALASIKLNWFTGFPQHEGLFAVRGWSLDDPPCVAYVQVRMFREELVCNLHCETSERDMRQWSPVRRFTATSFEWADVLATLPPPADGVVTDFVRVRIKAIAEYPLTESMSGPDAEALRMMAQELLTALNAAPPADSAMVEALRDLIEKVEKFAAGKLGDGNFAELSKSRERARTLLAGRK